MHALKHLLTVIVSSGLMCAASAEELHVAVAANFTAPMKAIVAGFEQASNHQVTVSFGSSGKIYAQIKNGAPYQVFLSADQTKPQALINEGYAVVDSRFTYAIGALALWSAKPGFVDESYTRLKEGAFNKLALANPKLAPYGAASVEVLEALKLRQALATKWVQGENIAQTYQFVATGNAELGFVALSQIMDKGHVTEGSTWIVPSELHSPIRQDAVLMKSAENSAVAKALLNYLQSDKARAIIRSYGYKTE